MGFDVSTRLFLIQPETDVPFREPCLQVSAGESKKPIARSEGAVTGRDHRKQFILSTLQDSPIQVLLKHLMRHILWFFLLLKAPSWQSSLLCFLPFLATASSNYPELNLRPESTPEWNVTMESRLLLPLFRFSPYPSAFYFLPFYTRDETSKRRLKPVIKCECGSTCRWIATWATRHWGNSSKRAIWALATAT